MKVKWKMDNEDTTNYTYTELNKCKGDLGITIECESDIDDPNLLVVSSTLGVYEPECYTYDAKSNSLTVYSWNKKV